MTDKTQGECDIRRGMIKGRRKHDRRGGGCIMEEGRRMPSGKERGRKMEVEEGGSMIEQEEDAY